jgi:hypothetical protein
LWREHLDRDDDQDGDLLHPDDAFDAYAAQAKALEDWYDAGQVGPRPPGRVRRHRPTDVSTVQRLWGSPLLRLVYDPDGRPLRDRVRRRP